MKAAILTAYGDPEANIKLQEMSEPPEPGDGQVLVQVEYSAINFSDILVARGLYTFHPDLPSVIGNEGVGRILKLGPQVEGLEVGDRVALPIGGFVWRERMLCAARELTVLPREADPSQLSMTSVNPPTAYLLLEDFRNLEPGQCIVLNAANSSIARWFIGFAKRKNLTTVGLVRRPEAARDARAAGCDLVVPDDDQAVDAIAGFLGTTKPVLALDANSGSGSGRLAKILGQGGTLVSYAAQTLTPMEIDPLDIIFKDLTVRGFSILYPRYSDRLPGAIRLAGEMIADGEVTVPIAASYTLDQVTTAVGHALRGGKVLLKIEDS